MWHYVYNSLKFKTIILPTQEMIKKKNDYFQDDMPKQRFGGVNSNGLSKPLYVYCCSQLFYFILFYLTPIFQLQLSFQQIYFRQLNVLFLLVQLVYNLL